MAGPGRANGSEETEAEAQSRDTIGVTRVQWAVSERRARGKEQKENSTAAALPTHHPGRFKQIQEPIRIIVSDVLMTKLFAAQSLENCAWWNDLNFSVHVLTHSYVAQISQHRSQSCYYTSKIFLSIFLLSSILRKMRICFGFAFAALPPPPRQRSGEGVGLVEAAQTAGWLSWRRCRSGRCCCATRRGGRRGQQQQQSSRVASVRAISQRRRDPRPTTAEKEEVTDCMTIRAIDATGSCSFVLLVA